MAEIRFTIQIEPEYDPPEDHLASDDPEADADLVRSIRDRLAHGDLWAWCVVIVRATYLVGHEEVSATASLGGCSYEDEGDFKRCGYWDSMREEARDELVAELAERVARGQKALDALKALSVCGHDDCATLGTVLTCLRETHAHLCEVQTA